MNSYLSRALDLLHKQQQSIALACDGDLLREDRQYHGEQANVVQEELHRMTPFLPQDVLAAELGPEKLEFCINQMRSEG